MLAAAVIGTDKLGTNNRCIGGAPRRTAYVAQVAAKEPNTILVDTGTRTVLPMITGDACS